MDFLTAVAAAVLTSAPMGFVVIALFAYRWYSRSRNRRNPLKQALLNAPGASLRASLRNNEDSLIMLFLAAGGLGAYILGFLTGQRVAPAQAYSLWVVAGLPMLGVVPFLMYRTVSLFRNIQHRRLGLDGEMEAGEKLNRLMHLGYEVFHDIPGPNYNVDHVVVGRNGVFAIETKTHAKPAADYKASTDGRVIRYPDYVDQKAIPQAQRNAQSLSRFLSSASGRGCPVKPVVVLPGWHVTRASRATDCVVLGSGEIQYSVPKLPGRQLAPEEIAAIVHQLDLLCRRERPLSVASSDTLKYEHKLTI